MFQFPAFASTPYVFRCQYPKGVGFPIRTSRDQSSLAAPPGLSQPNTSFIASMRQGIHQTPLAYFQPNPRMRIKVVCLVSHSPRPEGPWLTASRPTRSRGLISVIGNHLRVSQTASSQIPHNKHQVISSTLNLTPQNREPGYTTHIQRIFSKTSCERTSPISFLQNQSQHVSNAKPKNMNLHPHKSAPFRHIRRSMTHRLATTSLSTNRSICSKPVQMHSCF